MEKLDLQDIEGAFGTSFGLPRPDWGRIRSWIESRFEHADLEAAWTEAARQWFGKLGESLGGGHAVVESRSFLLKLKVWREAGRSSAGARDRR